MTTELNGLTLRSRRQRCTHARSLCLWSGALIAALLAVPTTGWAGDRTAYALVIGNNSAPGTELKQLHYADDDALRYAEMFRAAGIETVLLVEPDRETKKHFSEPAAAAVPNRKGLDQAIEHLFKRLAGDSKRGVETVFYFVYSGHGDVDRGGHGRVFLQDGALTRGELMRDIIGHSPATYNHLIVDACHAYFMVQPRGTGPSQSFAQVVRAYLDAEKLAAHPNTGVVISTSSRAEVHELSLLGAGLFSHQIRSALSGAADINNDGQVSYDELGAFLTTANQSIGDVGTKLVAYTQAPAMSASVPVFHTAGLDQRSYVRLPAALKGQITLVDDRGIRQVDLHHAGGTALTLALLPRPGYTIYAGDKPGEIHPLPGVDVDITWGRPTARRGVPTLRDAFAQPFGADNLLSFKRSRARGAATTADAKGGNAAAVPKQRVRIAFTIQGGAEEARIVPHAGNALLAGLASAGYDVVDAGQLGMVRESWSLAGKGAGELRAALSTLDADLLLMVEVDAESLGKVRKSSFLTARAEISYRLLRVDTAKAIAASSIERAGSSFTENSSVRKAAENAATALADELATSLPRLLSGPQRVSLDVRGMSPPSAATGVAKSLRRLSPVQEARVEIASPQLTRIELSVTGVTALTLADAIAADLGIALEVVQSTRSSIIAQHAPLRANAIGLTIEKSDVSESLAASVNLLPWSIAAEMENLTYLDARLAGEPGAEPILVVVERGTPQASGFEQH